MSRVVSWKVFVIVALSAFGALAPLKKWAYAEVGLWNGDRTRLLLYLMLAGVGVAFYCLRYYRLVFASGLASVALCLWSYWRYIWLPSTQMEGLTPLLPSRVGWGWLVWLAGAVFLCAVAVQEGIFGGESPRG